MVGILSCSSLLSPLCSFLSYYSRSSDFYCVNHLNTFKVFASSMWNWRSSFQFDICCVSRFCQLHIITRYSLTLYINHHSSLLSSLCHFLTSFVLGLINPCHTFPRIWSHKGVMKISKTLFRRARASPTRINPYYRATSLMIAKLAMWREMLLPAYYFVAVMSSLFLHVYLDWCYPR